jgi:hypothetical protein
VDNAKNYRKYGGFSYNANFYPIFFDFKVNLRERGKHDWDLKCIVMLRQAGGIVLAQYQ